MRQFFVKSVAVSSLMLLPLGFAQASPNYLQLSYNITHNTNLSSKAVEMAFAGYQWALKHNQVKNKDILTIVDFTVPAEKDRLYVINLNSGEILMHLPVTHGSGSGKNSNHTTSFSNKFNSLQSSIGVFITQNTYYGRHGLSLKINGLESSNNNALSRNVVVHSAKYASAEYIKKYGKPGQSWGCFAVDPGKSKQLINYISNGSVLYAYGQSAQYMASTKIAIGTISLS